jgi:hypothetical protein
MRWMMVDKWAGAAEEISNFLWAVFLVSRSLHFPLLLPMRALSHRKILKSELVRLYQLYYLFINKIIM